MRAPLPAFVALILLAEAAAIAAPAAPTVRLAADPAQRGWFVCDAVGAPLAAFVGRPGPDGTAGIVLLDRGTGATRRLSYQVGRADPGAGQINWALSQDGREVGSVHGVNPGMVDSGEHFLPPIKGIAAPDVTIDCRWLAHMRFLGLDARRSVVVTQEADGLVYRSYDLARRGPVVRPDGVQVSNAPTLEIAGGRAEGGGYRFAKGGYAYVVDPRGSGAVTVTRGGALVQTEAFAMGEAIAAEPEPAGTGADAVWSGEGLDACRAAETRDVDRCLADAMRASGATPAAIAFARRIAARGDTGYVSGWRQAGPVGVATIAYPFRANTNQGTALVPSSGDPIFVDDYRLGTQAMARPDYQALRARAGDVQPFAPATISGRRPLVGEPIVIRARTVMATCHACQPAGSMVVDYEFSPAGQLTMTRLVSIG